MPADPASAEELNKELDGLPLGTVHMTAVMRARKSSVKNFLRDYRRDKSRYHNKEAEEVTGIEPKSEPRIGTNWTIAFNTLEEKPRSFLGVLSLLSANMIPQDLFKHWDDSASRRTSGLLHYCENIDEYGNTHYLVLS